MGLTQTLATTLSGLKATQTGLSIVAGNVANAQTAGYVAKSATQIETATGDGGNAVQVASINRLLDTFVQQQLWTENAGGGYADLRANFYQQLQQVYGQPGSSTSLDSTFNNFTTAIQALSTTPSSTSAQSQALSAAQTLAQQLNTATSQVQSLRSQADQGIANDVQQVNDALQQIATINQQLVNGAQNDSTQVTLEDQRDQCINQLSRLMDIRVTHGNNDQITITTGTGTQLVGTQASVLEFNAAGTITPTQQWNADPTKSGLGTITIVDPSGATRDLVATGGIQSGEIAGYLNMRDNVLVQAQTQLDQIAAQMSSALSDTTTPASGVTVGAQSGFDADIGGLSNGNTIKLSYTDALNVQHNVTIVRVDDPSALPLSNSDTSDPNDTVIGVDFSGGAAAVASELNTALGSAGLQFSNPSGTTLEILNGSPAITVNSASTTTTATSLTAGSAALPLFTDGSSPYTGAFTAFGAEATGYAGRITVNSALLADPSKLVTYQTSPATQSGDATRPNFIYNQLVNAKLQYSPATGIGGSAAPYQGTLSDYMSQVVTTQSTATNAATNLQSGQDVVVNALQTRFNSTSAVSIDTEMANLLTLQNSYGANARVMSTVQAMLNALMQAM
ncbi:MAG TPA: flagellar hook-associated protein FlgK [Pseudolabrys sp.]|nr:flagellar hook-associated protein FlgK [Pseudolabrys sp.]